MHMLGGAPVGGPWLVHMLGGEGGGAPVGGPWLVHMLGGEGGGDPVGGPWLLGGGCACVHV